MKLLGIISVGFDVTDQLLIRFFMHSSDTGEKWAYNEAVYQLFTDFEKVQDSVRRDVLHCILIEFGVPMQLVRPIKICLNKTYCKVPTGNIFWQFSYKYGLKQGHTLSPLLFKFALEYAIRKAQDNQVWLKLNRTHQRLASGVWSILVA
jgi:hypothetical protein